MPAPDIIRQLVETFEQNREAYSSGKYNEAQLRQEFLNPFFEALGWDMYNRNSYAPDYREVIFEDSIEIEGKSKAPDYAFMIGKERKFFVEAKKPAVDIQYNLHPAYQLRRYAWNVRLPLSILTDFEEFAVYDCRNKPNPGDSAATGRVMLLNYRQYLEKWDEIAAIFSRDAVLKGSFDKFAEGTKGKRGTTEVDDAFLEEIERWRELLAHNIALRNPDITDEHQLNFAVQMTIDRIIFLRICEDRGIEPEDQLRVAAKTSGVYAELVRLFKGADQKYNSGLFHFSKETSQSSSADTFTPGLKIDDKVLKEIINSIYYPCPYIFNEIPVEILGQVYERFLGKVVRFTPAHLVKIEEKPEVRKAGGVYYTPIYIVNYIVQNTVGKLLEGKTPEQAAALKIVDPACGSGSFLLGAYQYLLDWHLQWYSDHEPQKCAKGKSPAIYQAQGGAWKLTTAEKKRILINNLHGVDIDPQAVEVTKLSLLLKVLEGESGQLSLGLERVLPDLGRNIQCGNSLIGPDYYEGQQLSLGIYDERERYRVNAFNWQSAFPQVFNAGGFDAVIGNPPYVRQEGLGEAKGYYRAHYKTYVPTADLYVNFIEKGLKILNNSGLFGMIVSNKWIRSAYGEPLRTFLTNNATLLKTVDLAGLPVFEGATVRTIILICSTIPGLKKNFQYLAPLSLEQFKSIRTGNDLEKAATTNSIEIYISDLNPKGWSFSDSTSNDLFNKLQQNSIPITKHIQGKPYFGIKTGFNEAYIIDRTTRDRLISENPNSIEIIKPILNGRDVKRYSLEYSNKFLIWTYVGVKIEKYPAIFAHLKQYQAKLQKRWDKGKYWWELRACDYYDGFEKPKIIYPDIAVNCRFCLDEKGYFGSNTIYFIPEDDRYLLGILNSKLAQYYFAQVCAGLEGGGTTYLRFFGQYIENFPVHNIESPTDKARHDRMVALVDAMLTLHQRTPRTPQEQERLSHEIEATDHQIDALVYELYGLTKEEIKIVEGE